MRAFTQRNVQHVACLLIGLNSCLAVLPTMIDPSRPSALKAHHYPRRAFRLHEMFMLVQLSVSCSCSWRIMTRLPRFGRESSRNGEPSDSGFAAIGQDWSCVAPGLLLLRNAEEDLPSPTEPYSSRHVVVLWLKASVDWTPSPWVNTDGLTVTNKEVELTIAQTLVQLNLTGNCCGDVRAGQKLKI